MSGMLLLGTEGTSDDVRAVLCETFDKLRYFQMMITLYDDLQKCDMIKASIVCPDAKKDLQSTLQQKIMPAKNLYMCSHRNDVKLNSVDKQGGGGQNA